MRVMVVLPTYQEAENVAEVLGRIRAALPDATILVVDDGSPDGTADLAEAVGRELGNIELLRNDRKGGLGPAYRAGFRRGLAAGYEVLVEIDADLSHDPSDLPRLVAEVERGADLAIGSRYVDGGSTPDWPSRRRWLSIWANRYAGFALHLPVHDATAGYRAYRSAMVARIDLDRIQAGGYGFQIEMAYAIHRLGGKIVEVPITFRDRVLGTSKMSGRIVAEAFSLVTWWGVRDRVLRRPVAVAR